ncbi:MAG: 50S ribosomal protein L22 [Candidatus Magasanikbacteria bacterium]|jgi:large subunit ribosomal protein L22|nr:50S ribosomal protein L22 [Candidatus Magasanikbacteria bacterium]
MKAQAIAKLRYLRTSPRKVRLLIDLIRGLKVEEAIAQLENSQKDASRPVLKLLKSAVANAVHNDGLDENTLIVKTTFVDKGPMLKRWMPRAMGRASAIHKHTSHVTLILEGEVKEGKKKIKKEKVKVEENKEVKNENKKNVKKTTVKKTIKKESKK